MWEPLEMTADWGKTSSLSLSALYVWCVGKSHMDARSLDSVRMMKTGS